MLEFPLIDAHVHLWDPQHFRMPWLDGDQKLGKRFAIPEYQAHSADVQVEAIVYVEVGLAPQYSLLEPVWVANRAREDQRIQGMVAAAPLEFGEQLREYLSALKRAGPLVKGVRRLVQDEPDAEFSARPAFIRGAQMLAEFDFSCDCCIRHWQMPSIIKLVRACPETQFMLDHLGKPHIKNHVLDPWRAQIKELAQLPNVMCKISGIVTEADHAHWTPDDLKPYVEHTLAVFGEDRVAFGGDWPVATLASPYDRWVKTLDSLTSHLSVQAKRKLWADNARRFYRL
ncbi:MAG TPA: amidohydrolase family protein [Planctomycetota bacterium]|jgi:L-fuconolactonase